MVVKDATTSQHARLTEQSSEGEASVRVRLGRPLDGVSKSTAWPSRVGGGEESESGSKWLLMKVIRDCLLEVYDLFVARNRTMTRTR